MGCNEGLNTLTGQLANSKTAFKTDIQARIDRVIRCLSNLPVMITGDSDTLTIHDEMVSIKKEIQAQQKENEWLPIETAQKNGDDIYLWNGEQCGEGYYSFYSDNQNRWEWCGEGFEVKPLPTHWRKRPKPPKGI